MDNQIMDALSLVYSRKCVPQSMLIQDMVNYFRTNNDQFVAVFEERKIVGIISREKMLFDIGSQFGWALYANKPVSALMDSKPLIVDGTADIISIFKMVISRPEERVYDDVIVVKERMFAGMISVRQLMRYHSEYLEEHLNIINQQKKLLEKTIAAHLLDKVADPDTWAKRVGEVVKTAQEMEILEEKSVNDSGAEKVPVTLQGCLDIFSVIDLIQLLVQGGKTGRLSFSGSSDIENTLYTVFIDHGTIVHAEGLDCSGKDALFEALRITSGNFVFYYNSLSDKITIQENPIFLLMEFCRLQDEEAFSNIGTVTCDPAI
jgi:hypothetical protein